MTNKNQDGRVLLVTGASTGIGAATAKLALQRGFSVVLGARSEDKLAALAQELGEAPRVVHRRCDVTDMESVQAFVQAGLERFGHLDAVFANAGVGGSPGGFSAADPESWRRMLMTNVFGVGLTVQATLPALRKSRGHMLLTGSVAGRRTLRGSMYSATKWAVSAIGYGLREELRGSGIRVTLIEPGMVDTPFFDNPKPDALRPEDIARSVLYALEQPPTVDVHEVLVMPTPPRES